jgi:hypothetical protein
MIMEYNRAAFEIWAKTQYLDLDTKDDYYTERATGIAWEAWKEGYTQCQSDNADIMC